MLRSSAGGFGGGFESFSSHHGVDAQAPEPVVAGLDPPAGLNEAEKALYTRVLQEPRGRLEQEFVPEEEVWEAVSKWAGESRTHLA